VLHTPTGELLRQGGCR